MKYRYDNKIEGMHVFIHSPQFGYYNGSTTGNNYTFCGNVMTCHSFVGTSRTSPPSAEKFEADANTGTGIVCVINRKSKKAVISRKFTNFTRYLIDAIPNNWEIILVDTYIPTSEILTRKYKRKLLELQAITLLQDFANRIASEICIIKGYTRALSMYRWYSSSWKEEIDNYSKDIYSEDSDVFASVKRFVEKNKLWHSKLYTTAVAKTVYVNKCKGWTAVQVPWDGLTLQQILEKRVFSEEEMLQIKQCEFWSYFCRYRGIKRAYMQEHWNSDVQNTNEIKQFFLHVSDKSLNSFVGKSWTSAIKNAWKEEAEYLNQLNERNRQLTLEHRAKAIEAQSGITPEKALDNFLHYIPYAGNPKSVTYSAWVDCYTPGKTGYWKEQTAYTWGFSFAHHVVRFTKNDYNKYLLLENQSPKIIKTYTLETNSNAKVKVVDAIMLWNIVQRYTPEAEKALIKESSYFKDFESKHIKCGLYNFRNITWTKKDIYVQVGCHNLSVNMFIKSMQFYKLTWLFKGMKNEK